MISSRVLSPNAFKNSAHSVGVSGFPLIISGDPLVHSGFYILRCPQVDGRSRQLCLLHVRHVYGLESGEESAKRVGEETKKGMTFDAKLDGQG